MMKNDNSRANTRKNVGSTATNDRKSSANAILWIIGATGALVLACGLLAWVLLPSQSRKPANATIHQEATIPNASIPLTKRESANLTTSPDPYIPMANPIRRMTGEEIYKSILKSTVFILIADGNKIVSGSGVLVDKQRKLVLTNYHVVEDSELATIFFPQYEKDGDLIVKPSFYKDNENKIGIPAKVVSRDSNKDLAILELSKVPADVEPIPLATKPSVVGSKLYSVGASGIRLTDFSGTLWRLSTGETRGRNIQTLTPGGQTIEAMFLESQKPINKGDSGGPTVNEAAALTGLVSLSDRSRDSVSLDIDLIEIESCLKRYAQNKGWVWNGPRRGLAGTQSDMTPFQMADAISKLVARLRDPSADVRLDALRKLATFGLAAQVAIPPVLKASDDSDARIQLAAEEVLNLIGPPGKVELLAFEEALTGEGKNGQRLALLYYLKQDKPNIPEKLISDVVRLIDSDTTEVAVAALQLLSAMKHISKKAGLLIRR